MKRHKVLLCMAVIGALLFTVMKVQAGAAQQQATAVELPQNLNFYLDPDNRNGRGQIYSDKYMIRNAGMEAVTFSIDMTLSLLDAQSSLIFCPKEWVDEPWERSIYMYAVFETGQEMDVCVLTDGGPCRKTVSLAPAGQEGDSVYISFGGRLSRSDGWKSGELAVDALYAMSVQAQGYRVGVAGEHIMLMEENVELIAGESAELHLMPEEGYFFPDEIRVDMGGQEAGFEYDAISGRIVLEEITDNVMIYANGMKKASLPDASVMNSEQMPWFWAAQAGVQGYEYSFWQDDVEMNWGQISVENGQVVWYWDYGLMDGTYQLRLKAIGDHRNCLDSEEGSYTVILNREFLRPSETPEAVGSSSPFPLETPEAVGTNSSSPAEDMKWDETPQPTALPEEDGKKSISPTEILTEGGISQPIENREGNAD